MTELMISDKGSLSEPPFLQLPFDTQQALLFYKYSIKKSRGHVNEVENGISAEATKQGKS
jgi:hypothetical protein